MPQIAVLLGTYQGERFLAPQLDSIFNQQNVDVVVYASDDGSTDATLSILKTYQEKFGADRLLIYQGPRKGFAANFMSLVSNPAIQADFFAFADQDDVWDWDKLSHAVSILEKTPVDVPALYCGRTRLVNEEAQEVGLSPLFNRSPGFDNALVQSIAGGNTMLFNKAARKLVMTVSLSIPSHDWLMYLFVSGMGGAVFYECIPRVAYRQHTSNLIGSNRGLGPMVVRLKRLCRNQLRDFCGLNVAALKPMRPELTSENQKIFDEFCLMREGHVFQRVGAFFRAGVHRQTFIQDVALFLAVIFKKV